MLVVLFGSAAPILLTSCNTSILLAFVLLSPTFSLQALLVLGIISSIGSILHAPGEFREGVVNCFAIINLLWFLTSWSAREELENNSPLLCAPENDGIRDGLTAGGGVVLWMELLHIGIVASHM